MIERYLSNILDVPGTEGLFLLNRKGQLLLTRMPEFVLLELYDNLIRRIQSLYETVDENFVPSDDYVLKYPQKWLILRRTDTAILCVLCDTKVNEMSLKMVSNMALKNITGAMLAQFNPIPIPSSTPVLTPAEAGILAKPPPAPPLEFVTARNIAPPPPPQVFATAASTASKPAPAAPAKVAEKPAPTVVKEEKDEGSQSPFRTKVARTERPAGRTYRGNTY